MRSARIAGETPTSRNRGRRSVRLEFGGGSSTFGETGSIAKLDFGFDMKFDEGKGKCLLEKRKYQRLTVLSLRAR